MAWGIALLLGLAAPWLIYPTFLMKVLCFALFACAFNLLLDAYAAGTVVTPVLLFDTTKAYRYLTQGSEHAVSGDQSLLVAKTALDPAVGSKVSVAGFSWKVLAKSSEVDAWLLHLRRV